MHLLTENFEKAYRFAAKAHHMQKRKYTHTPYIEHPIEVAVLVASSKNATLEMVQAALLHDVVEDTPFTLDAIERNFGPVVGEYVYYLSDISRPEDGNRKIRKTLDANHILSGPAEVHTIKVCDMISNSRSIKEFDENFWHGAYKEEKLYMLDLIAEKGTVDYKLLEMAYDIMESI